MPKSARNKKKKKSQPRKGFWSKLFSINTVPPSIQERSDFKLPTWEEFVHQVEEGDEKQEEESPLRFGLDQHQVFIDSPLFKNIAFLSITLALLFLGWKYTNYYQVIIYTAIWGGFGVAMLFALRDSCYFHLESLRIHLDSSFINKNKRGMIMEREQIFWEKLFRIKPKHRNDFRSDLFRLHFQNILRTFEQGDRKTWVNQSTSLFEIQTIISQGGMKLVWTCIEVLPQLGLIGTLAGMITMLGSFQVENGDGQTQIMEGFALALGTTILANILVLVLRPIYMQNERTMFQILSTLEGLMETFILPTQKIAMYKENPARQARKLNSKLDTVIQNLNQKSNSLRQTTQFEKEEQEIVATEIRRLNRNIERILSKQDVEKANLETLKQVQESVRELQKPVNQPPAPPKPKQQALSSLPYSNNYGNRSFNEGNQSPNEGNQSPNEGNQSYNEGNQSYNEENQSYNEENQSYNEGNQSYNEGNQRSQNDHFNQDESSMQPNQNEEPQRIVLSPQVPVKVPKPDSESNYSKP